MLDLINGTDVPTLDSLFDAAVTTDQINESVRSLTYTVKNGDVKNGGLLTAVDAEIKGVLTRFITVASLNSDGNITNVWVKRGKVTA
jgi:hypothetical protein